MIPSDILPKDILVVWQDTTPVDKLVNLHEELTILVNDFSVTNDLLVNKGFTTDTKNAALYGLHEYTWPFVKYIVTDSLPAYLKYTAAHALCTKLGVTDEKQYKAIFTGVLENTNAVSLTGEDTYITIWGAGGAGGTGGAGFTTTGSWVALGGPTITTTGLDVTVGDDTKAHGTSPTPTTFDTPIEKGLKARFGKLY